MISFHLIKMRLSCRLCGIYFPKGLINSVVYPTTQFGHFNSGGTRKFSCSKAQLSGQLGVGTGKPARLSVDLEPSAEDYLVKNNLKIKNHPGVYHLTRRVLPDKFIDTVKRIFSHENIKSLLEPSDKLRKYLWSRHLPIEEEVYRRKVEEVEAELEMKDDILRPFLSADQLKRLEAARESKIRNHLKKKIYHWEPIDFDKSVALQYLLGRSPGEYAALVQIFSEIERRDKNFVPYSLCDFGSGIGTTVWASKTVWPKNVNEVLCADVSKDMNDLAERLLRGGNMDNDHGFEALFFRQFLAQSSKVDYDLVVSAYSLMELPSLKQRLKTLDILWKKTSGYLVIVEQGSAAGFKAVIEARDYILELDKGHQNELSHVFSPCPHDSPCPRFVQDDRTCHFYVKYGTLYPFHRDNTGIEKFSYVVLKKGPRDQLDEKWPRLIRDPMLKSRHCICRVCTKDGKLAEVVLTKSKHSKMLYRIGRKSKCGDLLPVRENDNDVSYSHIDTEKMADDDDDVTDSEPDFDFSDAKTKQ